MDNDEDQDDYSSFTSCQHCGVQIHVGNLHCALCQDYLNKCDQQLDDEKDNGTL